MTAIGTPAAPLSLAQLGSVLARRDKVPYGFFISQTLWNSLAARFRKEAGDPLAPIPNTLQGVQIVVDPDMPDTSFEVAFTAEAWTKRLRELEREPKP